MSSDQFTSRFIVVDDPSQREVVFALPAAWWSRPYEYAWAERFVRPGAVVLDAACGVSHPFKLKMVSLGAQVHACDLDPRITSREAMQADIVSDFGRAAAEGLDPRLIDGLRLCRATLGALPYEAAAFDAVFCISVLEHLADAANSHPMLARASAILRTPRLRRREVADSLREFRRVVKTDGVVVLTFDHPLINLSYLDRVLPAVGLAFAGPVESAIPPGALYEPEHRLHCYRAVLRPVAVI